MHIVYNLLLHILTPVAILRLLWKSRKNPAYRWYIPQRFAYHLPATTHHPLWIHTVSVGEFIALRPLLIELLHHHPTLPLWLTCTTPTARVQLTEFSQQHPQRITYSYLPYDTTSNIQRFLNHVQPCGVILMETEIWLNLLQQSQRRNIPTLLINARLSAKSLRGYYRFARRLFQRVLPALHINAQNKQDAKRFQILSPQSQINITPSIKFVAPALEISPLQDFLPIGSPVILAASTHRGEEKILIQCLQELQQTLPTLRLCIAPRHPERCEEIKQIAQKAGYHVIYRSKKQSTTTADTIAILDTLGELNRAYASANVAFIGGSFIEHGGHNPLEALHAGCPICFGESMYNFQSIREKIIKQTFVRQSTPETVSKDIISLLKQQDRQAIIRYSQSQSQNILERHRLFIEKHIKLSKIT